MRSQLKLITFFIVLIVMATSMAVVYKLIPVQAAALVGVVSITMIAAVISRRLGAESQGLSKRRAVGVLRLIWPLLLGAVVAIFGVWRDGWKVGDTIGATVCFLLLAAYVLISRKRKDGVSDRE